MGRLKEGTEAASVPAGTGAGAVPALPRERGTGRRDTMAHVDGVRIFRGIYGGFALAMSEAEEGARFHRMPSSDEMASKAFDIASQLIADDEWQEMSGAHQEFVSMAVALALIGHGGAADQLRSESIRDTVGRLVSLIAGPRDEARVPAQAR